MKTVYWEVRGNGQLIARVYRPIIAEQIVEARKVLHPDTDYEITTVERKRL